MLTPIQQAFGRLAVHQGFRRYFSNTSWMFAEQVLRILAGLFVGIYVARYLGPQQFGVYSYATAFVALFGAIAKLGLDNIVVRDLVQNPEQRDVYLGTAFWLKLIGAILLLITLAVAVQFSSNDATTNLYIFIIASGLVFQSFEVVDFYFRSKVLSKYVSIAKLSQLGLSSLLKLYFIFIQADLFWFVLVSLIDQISLALSLAFAYWRKKMGSFYRHFEFGTAKNLLRDCWPLMLSGIAIATYMRIDQIMIKEMIGEREVGLYSAAVRLSEAWHFVPVIITTSLFPAIVNARMTDKEVYNKRLQRLYSSMVWMAITIAVPMTFLSNWVVELLYGIAYHEAGQVLMIHIWAGVFVALGATSSSWLISENLQQMALYRTLSGAISNVILNLILIRNYGIVGAAISTVISYMIAGFIFDLFSNKTRKMFFMKIDAFFLKGIRTGSPI
jgi:O-antigen/teichoic acid export membrane protein